MVLHGLYSIAGYLSGTEAVSKDCCFSLKACSFNIKNSVEKKGSIQSWCLWMIFMLSVKERKNAAIKISETFSTSHWEFQTITFFTLKLLHSFIPALKRVWAEVRLWPIFDDLKLLCFGRALPGYSPCKPRLRETDIQQKDLPSQLRP